MKVPRHDLNLYETDAQYVDVVGTLVAEGLAKGETCVVIATGTRREALARWLREKGVMGRRASRLMTFDAARTLSRFMVNGMPQRAFSLRCSYPVGAFRGSARGHALGAVCAEHGAILA